MLVPFFVFLWPSFPCGACEREAIPTLACHDVCMLAQTICQSAATLDPDAWRDLLHDAFSRAGFHV